MKGNRLSEFQVLLIGLLPAYLTAILLWQGPVVEIFSSDEEDNDTGDMSAVFQPLHIDQQKGCALRSTNGRR